MRRSALAMVAVTCALAACAAPVPPAATTPTAVDAAPAAATTTGGTAAIATNRVTIDGAVRVPNGLVAAGGMNLVAAGGMNLVAAGGMNLVAAGGMNLVAAGSMNLVAAGGMNLTAGGNGNLVAAGGMNYRNLLAVSDQALGGVVVFLCDGLGRPIPGLPPVATDEAGRYTIPHVPAGFTLVVNALVPYKDGKRGLLVALVRSGAATPVEVDAASTLAAIRAAAIRKDGQLGEFEATVFKNAVGDVRNALTDPTTPDYRDAVAVGLKAAELEAQVPGLAEKLTALRTSLAKGPTTNVGPAGPNATPLPAPSVPPPPQAAPTPGATTTPNLPLYTPKPTPTAPPTPADCAPPRTHTFKTSILGGARVVFRKRDEADPNRLNWPIRASVLLEADGTTTKPVDIPEGCVYRVELLSGAGTTLGSNDAWAVPVGSLKLVQLPF